MVSNENKEKAKKNNAQSFIYFTTPSCISLCNYQIYLRNYIRKERVKLRNLESFLEW